MKRADGRCEACGIPGSIRHIDVDHNPESPRPAGKVTLPDGGRVRADGGRNLQLGAAGATRGKRDTSTYNFRPSADRLRETVVLTLQKAQSLGYDWKRRSR